MSAEPVAVRYRFGDAGRVGVLMGCSLRQSAPLVAGVLWLTLGLMAGLPLMGMTGPLAGAVVSFGRWRRAPLYEVAVPGARLAWRTFRQRTTWTVHPVTDGDDGADLPGPMRGLEIVEVDTAGPRRPPTVGVVRDREAGTVSLVVEAVGEGFPVASAGEQDQLVAGWGAALAPCARAQCPVSRLTWQEWTHPVGLSAHREFLAARQPAGVPGSAAGVDYQEVLDAQAPYTAAHDVLVTVTVEVRRVRRRRGVSQVGAAVEALLEEARLLGARLQSAGIGVSAPLSRSQLSWAVQTRTDSSIPTLRESSPGSLAAAVGRGAPELGPLTLAAEWGLVRVDGSFHRSYRVATWPMLPVPAEWLAPLLTVEGVTRTVTVVLEPVAIGLAAAHMNRQLTSIEADQQQKERHGFRLTARERRRHADVEARERELAEGHPEFRHVALVTVTAPTEDGLDEACARVEQAAAQSLLDLRPVFARQVEGWVASLPLGRSVRTRGWAR